MSILRKHSPHVLYNAVDFISMINSDSLLLLSDLLTDNQHHLAEYTKVITAVITPEQSGDQILFVQ
jgi:hypothetical protein